MIRGIDVSAYQEGLQLHEVKSWGGRFVYAKATEGTSYIDPSFSNFHRAAGEVDLPFGGYHFYHFTDSPTLQAAHFLQTLNPKPGDLLPMVDVEVEKFDAQALATFLKSVEARIGQKMLIYTYYSYWNDVAGGSSDFSGHPLWIAETDDPSIEGNLPRGWRDWNMWQYGQENIGGVLCDVDMAKSLLRISGGPPGQKGGQNV